METAAYTIILIIVRFACFYKGQKRGRRLEKQDHTDEIHALEDNHKEELLHISHLISTHQTVMPTVRRYLNQKMLKELSRQTS